jgi:glycosyltransferase involved in cell wall biosynthesis
MMKLAFLHANFPKLTTTFVNREFEYLSERTALQVCPIALKRPAPQQVGQEYEPYLHKTMYIWPDHALAVIGLNLWAMLTQPGRYGRTLTVMLGEAGRLPLARLLPIIFHFLCGIYLSYYLTRHNFEAVHAHFTTASNLALVAHLFGCIPFFFTLHANEMYTGAVLLEPKLKHARWVITNNSYNRKHINLLTNYRYRDKISVIYNGLDLAQFAGGQAKTHRSDPMRLISIGSLRGFKGYPTVIEALAQLKQEGLAFTYTIIGGGRRDEQAMLERLIAEYELGPQVRLLGSQPFPRVRAELEAADLEIMASEIFDVGRRDGFPNVIIEAMLLKRPVVTTYISDIPTLVKHGETGYLFPEKNAADLAKILGHLYHAYEETVPVVERAYRMTIQTFDAQKNYALLTKILRGHSRLTL